MSSESKTGTRITLVDGGKAQHRIRLAGIDAPEKGQVFGEQSKQNPSALVLQLETWGSFIDFVSYLFVRWAIRLSILFGYVPFVIAAYLARDIAAAAVFVFP